MRIAIDATSLLDQYSNRGIGTYTKNLLAELLKNKDHEWHLIGFLDKQRNLSKIGGDFTKHQNVIFHSIGKLEPSTVLTNKKIDKKIKQILNIVAPEIYFVPNFEHTVWKGEWRSIAMIHDLIPLATNSFSQKGFLINILKRKFYVKKLKKVALADHIITNSEFSKSEVVRLLNIPSEKITPIPLGQSKKFESVVETNTENILQSLGIKDKYLLYYGGLETNKNVPYLIEVFNKILKKRSDIKLVIVSAQIKENLAKSKPAKKLLKQIKKLGIGANIIFPGEVKNNLPLVLKNAEGFIHLSKMEGFGLSVLESLQLGIPAFVSDIAVYRSLFEGGCKFVSLTSVDATAKQILETLDDKKILMALSKAALNKAAQFSWEKTAESTLEVFSKIRYSKDVFTKPKRNHVAFVAPYFFPYKGGAENYAFNIASRLVDENFKVDAYSSKYGKKQKVRTKKFGINIKRHRILTSGYYTRFYPGLLLSVLGSRANIFHVQGFGFIWQDICLILKRFFSIRRIKFVNTPHGPFMARQEYTPLQLKIKKTFTWIQRLYLNWLYDVIITVNPLQARWIHEEYGISLTKIKFLPIGLPASHFKSIDLINTKKELNPDNKVVGTFLGRFHQYKGVLSIIESIASLTQENKNLIFIFIGKDAGALKKMKNLINLHKLNAVVKIIQGPTDKKRDAILELSDFFVFPSEWEAYGIAMLEAMAHQNAVISTETEGGKFLVSPGKSGMLYSHGDDKALTEAMRILITDPKLREQMKQESFEKAKNLTWEKLWGEYIELYKSIAL